MKTRARVFLAWLMVVPLVASIGVVPVAAMSAVAAESTFGPQDVSYLRLPGQGLLINPELAQATGEVQVVIQLSDAPLSVAYATAARFGDGMGPAQQRDYLNHLEQRQNALLSQIQGLGGRELGRVSKALNALVVTIDASQIAALSRVPTLRSVRLVQSYEVALSQTIPHIGAAAVQAAGFDGTGVRVAVLDTGIDYTHASLGGLGTAAAYEAAYGTTTADARNKNTDGLFPTAKVIGGHDFVGETWPSGALAPDPDPIDCGPAAIPPPCAGGHGTHVSDIIGGTNGVAPGVSFYAVKVCSSVSTACSGVALLQGMDFALDPNGDGDISDAVDVINMSLGSSYGQKEDDLSAASANAVRAGVVVVASAGNSADRPYIVGSPSTTPEVISVAATFHPTLAKMYPVQTPVTSPVGSIWQSWSAAPSLVSGSLVYDTANANTRRGCSNAAGASPWVGTPHTGKVLLIDRGLCAVSQKVSNAAAAGAVAAIIANNLAQAPGDVPPSFSFGGGTPTISGYTITLADGNTLKGPPAGPPPGALGQTATINPANAVSLAKNMAAFSSRGPSYSFNSIKPDIGAPGTDILSAQAGSGTGGTPFGGTSASAPVVSGTAALLVDAYPTRTPSEIKALLMNTADPNIGLNPVGLPGVLAPITRIGAGEVRVNEALDTTTAAWDRKTRTGSLSFGYHVIADDDSEELEKVVVVRNYGNTQRTYSITTTFRYSADAASGAVKVIVPKSITVGAHSSATFEVEIRLKPTNLPFWDLNGGSRGGDGFRLQGVEFDGLIRISDANDVVHVPWHVLPRRAADVEPRSDSVRLSDGVGKLVLRNDRDALTAGRVDVFSLLGTSARLPKKSLPQPGDNFAIIDLKSIGVRLVSVGGAPAAQFAIDTFGLRAHPNYPAEFDILIDSKRDGTPDFAIFSLENGGFAASGQNVVAAGPLPAGPFAIRFFTDADLNSGGVILTALLSDIGLTPSTKFDFSVFAVDNYFTGALTDAIEGITYTLDTPRFFTDVLATVVPVGGRVTLMITAVEGGDSASPSQTGILLMYRDGPGSQQIEIEVEDDDDDDDDDGEDD